MKERLTLRTPVASESADGSEGGWIEMMLASASASANVMDRPGPPVPPVAMAVLLAREKGSAMAAGAGAVAVIVVYGRRTKSGSCAPKACLILARLMDHCVAASIAISTGDLVHGSCTQVRAHNLSINCGEGLRGSGGDSTATGTTIECP